MERRPGLGCFCVWDMAVSRMASLAILSEEERGTVRIARVCWYRRFDSWSFCAWWFTSFVSLGDDDDDDDDEL